MSESSFGLPPNFCAPGYEALEDYLSNPYDATILGDTDTHVTRINYQNELLIVRHPNTYHDFDSDEEAVDFFAARIEALRRGLGGRGLEQMVYYDLGDSEILGDQRVVTRHALGRSLTELPAPVVTSISEEDYSDLYSVITEEVKVRNIVPDTASADNLVYDPEAGFTIIDYTPAEPQESVSTLTAGALSAMVLWQTVDYWTAVQDNPVMRSAWLTSFKTGFTALQTRFPTILDELSDSLETYRRFILNVEDYLG